MQSLRSLSCVYLLIQSSQMSYSQEPPWAFWFVFQRWSQVQRSPSFFSPQRAHHQAWSWQGASERGWEEGQVAAFSCEIITFLVDSWVEDVYNNILSFSLTSAFESHLCHSAQELLHRRLCWMRIGMMMEQ